jgi:type IV pilus assembly protein PilC
MPRYAFVAKDRGGSEERGFVDGTSPHDALSALHARGLVVINLAASQVGGARRLNPLQAFLQMEVVPTRVGVRDTALFTRQLATMVAAGIPLVRGLRGLSADSSNAALRKITGQMADTIDTGEQLSTAMAEHPRAFSSLAVSMVRAGEAAGTLDQILDQLAVYLEKVDAIRSKVKAAMAYPVFVVIFALCAFLFMLLKIVPTFKEIYEGFGAELPAPTRAVLAVSDWLRGHIPLAIAGALVLGLLAYVWRKTPHGRYWTDRWLVTMPVFGPIIRNATVSRFVRTFGVLMSSGLPVLQAIDHARDAAQNAYLARGIAKARRDIEEGREITASFRQHKVLPEVVLQLMSTGEETGQLTSMLLKASDFYDRQVEAAVAGLTALIEPLLIIFVGIIVGIIVVTMFLPIFYLGDAVFWSEFKR